MTVVMALALCLAGMNSAQAAPLLAPKTPSVINQGPTFALLDWSGSQVVLGLESYEIEVSTDHGNSWNAAQQIVRDNATFTQAGLSGLTPNQSYEFRVRSITSTQSGPWSQPSIETNLATQISHVDLLHVTSKSGTSVSLAWQAPHGQDASKFNYQVDISNDNGQTWNHVDDSDLMRDSTYSTTATVLNLVRGEPYLFSITAYNEFTKSPPAILNGAVQVVSGMGFYCALLSIGRVKCWGLNTTGNLGDGTRATNTTPVFVDGIDSAVELSTSGYTTCALLADTSVKCWGANYNGMLGTGSFSPDFSTTAVSVVNLVDIKAISVGLWHACALDYDGGTWCWGRNQESQVTSTYLDSALNRPHRTDFTKPALQVVSGVYHTCVLYTDYSVGCKGYRGNGELVGDGLADIATLSTGSSVLTCGIGITLQCWGVDGNVNKAFDTKLLNPKAVSVQAGNVCQISSDNQLQCQGNNYSGSNSPTLSPWQTLPISGYPISIGPNSSYVTDSLGGVQSGGGQVTGIGGVDSAVIPRTAPGVADAPTSNHHSKDSITLNWKAPDNGGATLSGYDVRMKTSTSSTWNPVITNLSRESVLATTALISGLQPGTKYLFEVRANNIEGNGSWSSPSSEILAAGPPDQVQSLVLDSKDQSSMSISWPAANSNGSAITNYLVEYSSNDGQSWSTAGLPTSNYMTISNLTRGQPYLVRITAVNLEGTSALITSPLSVIPADCPSTPQSPSIIQHDATSAIVSWSSPDNGGEDISHFDFSYSVDAGSSWTDLHAQQIQISQVNSNTATLPLETGNSYVFRLRACNNSGCGNWSLPSISIVAVTPPNAPSAPLVVQIGSTQSLNFSLSWDAPQENGRSITNYKIRTSDDNGQTWNMPRSLNSSALTTSLNSLTSASAQLIQVAAENSEGLGPWSPSALITTPGARKMRVKVTDSTNNPIIGGAITWKMVDNSAESSITYGLTADGIIDFPYAPSGQVRVQLANGIMSDGTVVSGTWTTTLGFTSTILQTPSLENFSQHNVSVVLPNGLPVPNVQVALSSTASVSSTKSIEGFNFVRTASATSGVTDLNGTFTFNGFTSGSIAADITYNDGVIIQRQRSDLSGPSTVIQLQYMPWTVFDTSSVSTTSGAPTTITVSSLSNNANTLRSSGRVSLLNGQSGIKVKLIPTTGTLTTHCTNKKIRQITSAVTDSHGKAKFVICPTKSGTYKLSSQGATSSSTTLILVKGSAPMPVNSVTAKSTKPGSASLSWNKPYFSGGSPVIQYTIVLKAKNKPVITKVISAKVDRTGKVIQPPLTSISITGLANACDYQLSVTAKSALGTSSAFSQKVPIA